MEYIWKPLQCYQKNSELKHALVILNQPLNGKLVSTVWTKALLKICVDGGTNRLYDTFSENRENFIPDIITGDFDSLRSEVRQYFVNKGVKVIETEDQNYTDFAKAIKVNSENFKENQIKSIIVLDSFGGRFDHVFGNINSLFEARNFTDIQIQLVSEDTTAFLLQPGHHHIDVDPRVCGEWCGLIPIGEPCNSVTTTGLKWNVENQKLQFGDLISTSNTLEGETTKCVTIATDKPLLWTMGVKGDEIL